ncbi:hypothetical protein N9C06_05260 [Salibacteraceae bacterium]|nr:hypothetical protein [Salibacteraceae bacterium]
MDSGKSFFGRLLYYINPLTLFKKSDNKNVNLKMMHGMNRISMMMFLVCLIIILVKFVF